VAAHSMVRALYDGYAGPLYSVQRSSDKATVEIGVIAGGLADSSKQDEFCADATCTVQRIFDQSPQANHLDVAPGGGAAKDPDSPVDASKARIVVGGHPVYGAFFEGKMGYRNNNATGIATGDDAETIYAVMDGVHYNEKCCFDYGNAETDSKDEGKGTMEALYWGNFTGWAHHMGAGSGPWVAADLENGVWAGKDTINPDSPSLHFEFATAMIKGKPGNVWALKAGDAQKGPLQKIFEGARPAGYEVMKKQGGIILGIGGDNSNGSMGTFYEGVMTAGYSSDAADAALQADIVKAGYAHEAAIVQV